MTLHSFRNTLVCRRGPVEDEPPTSLAPGGGGRPLAGGGRPLAGGGRPIPSRSTHPEHTEVLDQTLRLLNILYIRSILHCRAIYFSMENISKVKNARLCEGV